MQIRELAHSSSKLDVSTIHTLTTVTYAYLDVSYEILNKAGTVFKAIDSLSGKCIVMKKLKTLCNHDTCVQEEELWNKVGMDSTTKSKLVISLDSVLF